MASVASARGWMVPVFGLFVATFAICTAELIVTGLLPAISADLGVDVPTVGLLITGYALGVAFASPVVALVTGGIDRKALLLAALGIFVLGNILCALSASYWMLLGARLVVAACHGLFFGVAMVIAMRLAPEGRQTTAVSLVVAGVTLANVLGVPIGTAIGNAYGWRATFWAIAIAGGLAAVTILILIPRSREESQKKAGLAAEWRAATRPVVLYCYAIITLNMVGVLAIFAYIVPLLTEVSGVPAAYVPWVLFMMGGLGFFGNLIGGRLGDWNPTVTLICIFSTVVVLLLVLTQVVTITWAALAIIGAMWFVGFGFPAPVQGRILRAAREAPNFASTLISSAFNIGIAGGAALGAAAIAQGWGYKSLPWIDAAFVSLALLATLALLLHDRRANAAVPEAAE